MTVAQANFSLQLSAVVQLIDGFTGLPAFAPALFAVDGLPSHPLPKSQGFHAFTDLVDGMHRIEVVVGGFFPQACTVTVPPHNPLAESIVVCTLAPDPLYPYPAWISVIQGQVTDPLGTPLGDVAVGATYPSRSGASRHLQTRTDRVGAYDGRYALGLTGRPDPNALVTLSFDKAGYASQTRTLVISSAATHFVDVALAPE